VPGLARLLYGVVMDYLFEILDLWEKAKTKESRGFMKNLFPRVPKHNGVIDVMGGTSGWRHDNMYVCYLALNGKIPIC